MLESVYAVSAKIVDMIMQVAPFAVACLLFNNVARFGLDLLGALSWFVLTVLLGLGAPHVRRVLALGGGCSRASRRSSSSAA